MGFGCDDVFGSTWAGDDTIIWSTWGSVAAYVGGDDGARLGRLRRVWIEVVVRELEYVPKYVGAWRVHVPFSLRWRRGCDTCGGSGYCCSTVGGFENIVGTKHVGAVYMYLTTCGCGLNFLVFSREV